MWVESFILSAVGVLSRVVCLSPEKATQQTTKQDTWQDHTARWLLCAGSVFCHSDVSVLGGWLGRKMSHCLSVSCLCLVTRQEAMSYSKVMSGSLTTSPPLCLPHRALFCNVTSIFACLEPVLVEVFSQNEC